MSEKTVGERLVALERETQAMLGMIAGQHVVLSALLAKHHDYEQLQLWLTSILEIADATLFEGLSESARLVARQTVEQLQQSHQVRGEIRPPWPGNAL